MAELTIETGVTEDSQLTYQAIAAERIKQHTRWRGTTGDCSDPKTPDSWSLAILTEEVGEVARAVLTGDRDNLEAELIQVAAVAVSWIEGLNRPVPSGEGGD